MKTYDDSMPFGVYTPTDAEWGDDVDVDDHGEVEVTRPEYEEARVEIPYGQALSYDVPHEFEKPPSAVNVKPLTPAAEVLSVYVTFGDESVTLHCPDSTMTDPDESRVFEMYVIGPGYAHDLAALDTDAVAANPHAVEPDDEPTTELPVRAECPWPVSLDTAARLTLADLGALNLAHRQAGTRENVAPPTIGDLRRLTVMWLAGACGWPETEFEGIIVLRPGVVSERLRDRGYGDAADALDVAIERAEGWEYPRERGAGAGAAEWSCVAYQFTRLYAPDYETTPITDTEADDADTDADADADDADETTTMPEFDITDHIETETVTEPTTTTTNVPTRTDSDGEVLVETETEVAVEREHEAVVGGCAREGCTEEVLPVDAAIPVVTGAAEDGSIRTFEAWCPFCARSVFGADAVDGEREFLLPPGVEPRTESDATSGDESASVSLSWSWSWEPGDVTFALAWVLLFVMCVAMLPSGPVAEWGAAAWGLLAMAGWSMLAAFQALRASV